MLYKYGVGIAQPTAMSSVNCEGPGKVKGSSLCRS